MQGLKEPFRDPSQYADQGAYVPRLGEPVLDLLTFTEGMRILDLGCGNGTLTQKLVARGASVMGVDSSPDMVFAAQQLGLDACVMDGYHLEFQDAFDAVFSNAALHWMTRDPDAVLNGVYRALKPGGQFVAEMGGDQNIAQIREALDAAIQPYGLLLKEIDPIYFPTSDEYHHRLQQAGFQVEQIHWFRRPTPLPGGIRDWVKTFSRRTLDKLPESEIETVLYSVETALASKLKTETGWVADYVRLRFKAVKPDAS